MSLQPWEPNNPNSFPPIQLLVRITASTHYTYRRFRNVEVLHTHTHTHTGTWWVHTDTQTHTGIHTSHDCLHTNTLKHVWPHAHAITCVCDACEWDNNTQVQHSFKRAYTHTHTHTYTHTHIHKHTHTHTSPVKYV